MLHPIQKVSQVNADHKNNAKPEHRDLICSLENLDGFLSYTFLYTSICTCVCIDKHATGEWQNEICIFVLSWFSLWNEPVSYKLLSFLPCSLEKLEHLSFIKYDLVHEFVKLLRCISSRRTQTLKPSAFSSSTMLFIQMRILNKKVTSLGQFSLFAQQELRTLFKLLNSISVAWVDV